MFGHVWAFSAAFVAQLLLLMVPKFPSWPHFFAILCWLGNTQDVLANGSKPYPERSQRLFSHRWPGVGRIIRKCHPFCELRSHWVAATAGGCISGRLRPTHLVAQVDDSKTMGYVLTGRLLFWSRCIWYGCCRRNIWCILGGEAIQQVLLDQCPCAEFAMLVELAMPADVNWSLSILIANYWSTHKLQGQWFNDDIGWCWFISYNYHGFKIERAPKRARCFMKKGSAWLCSDHGLHESFIHQPRSKRLVFYVWTCLGLQCCFCSAATASDGAKVSLVTIFFCNLMLTREYSGRACKW